MGGGDADAVRRVERARCEDLVPHTHYDSTDDTRDTFDSLIKNLQAQLVEVEREKEELRGQRDAAFTREKKATEIAEKAKTEWKKNHETLSKNLETMEARVKKAEEGEYDRRRACNLKQDELEKVEAAEKILARAEQIRAGADRDLLQAMTTTRDHAALAVVKSELQDLQDAAEPILGMFPPEGDESMSLLDRMNVTPGRIKQYMRELAHSVVAGILTIVRLHLPSSDLKIVKSGPLADTRQ
ncbi:uncharacterized protein [Miscanthus floridulus]|uniref:uncharacterized protein n=1 Tax=Miscanthus floridulus TaxID=154761 RepID=UPI003458C762